MLQALGRLDEAETECRTALRLRPEYPQYPQAHNNLVIALQATGRVGEAGDHYRSALRLKPDFSNDLWG